MFSKHKALKHILIRSLNRGGDAESHWKLSRWSPGQPGRPQSLQGSLWFYSPARRGMVVITSRQELKPGLVSKRRTFFFFFCHPIFTSRIYNTKWKTHGCHEGEKEKKKKTTPLGIYICSFLTSINLNMCINSK